MKEECHGYCPTAGTREVIIQEGPYKGAHSDVEWETIYARAFGSKTPPSAAVGMEPVR